MTGRSGDRWRVLGRGLAETLREWVAGIGLAGGLIGGASVVVEGKQGSVAGVLAIVLALAAVVFGLLGIRADRRGWLYALVALVAAVAVFVILNLAT